MPSGLSFTLTLTLSLSLFRRPANRFLVSRERYFYIRKEVTALINRCWKIFLKSQVETGEASESRYLFWPRDTIDGTREAFPELSRRRHKNTYKFSARRFELYTHIHTHTYVYIYVYIYIYPARLSRVSLLASLDLFFRTDAARAGSRSSFVNLARSNGCVAHIFQQRRNKRCQILPANNNAIRCRRNGEKVTGEDREISNRACAENPIDRWNVRDAFRGSLSPP